MAEKQEVGASVPVGASVGTSVPVEPRSRSGTSVPVGTSGGGSRSEPRGTSGGPRSCRPRRAFPHAQSTARYGDEPIRRALWMAA